MEKESECQLMYVSNFHIIKVHTLYRKTTVSNKCVANEWRLVCGVDRGLAPDAYCPRYKGYIIISLDILTIWTISKQSNIFWL